MLEAHVTIPPFYAVLAQQVSDALGWHTSQIARDEVMGDKNWFYCTLSGNYEFDDLRKEMETLCAELRRNAVPYVRKKIEEILYDERFTLPPAILKPAEELSGPGDDEEE